jgi:hypothetical protein
VDLYYTTTLRPRIPKFFLRYMWGHMWRRDLFRGTPFGCIVYLPVPLTLPTRWLYRCPVAKTLGAPWGGTPTQLRCTASAPRARRSPWSAAAARARTTSRARPSLRSRVQHPRRCPLHLRSCPLQPAVRVARSDIDLAGWVGAALHPQCPHAMVRPRCCASKPPGRWCRNHVGARRDASSSRRLTA